jgi:hypothetical protein
MIYYLKPMVKLMNLYNATYASSAATSPMIQHALSSIAFFTVDLISTLYLASTGSLAQRL